MPEKWDETPIYEGGLDSFKSESEQPPEAEEPVPAEKPARHKKYSIVNHALARKTKNLFRHVWIRLRVTWRKTKPLRRWISGILSWHDDRFLAVGRISILVWGIASVGLLGWCSGGGSTEVVAVPPDQSTIYQPLQGLNVGIFYRPAIIDGLVESIIVFQDLRHMCPQNESGDYICWEIRWDEDQQGRRRNELFPPYVEYEGRIIETWAVNEHLPIGVVRLKEVSGPEEGGILNVCSSTGYVILEFNPTSEWNPGLKQFVARTYFPPWYPSNQVSACESGYVRK